MVINENGLAYTFRNKTYIVGDRIIVKQNHAQYPNKKGTISSIQTGKDSTNNAIELVVVFDDKEIGLLKPQEVNLL